MKRDLNKLSGTEYDVVIVGAGVYGVCAVWDATLRGLKAALIDKGDFAGATSSNSLKTIHGGLRYLQNMDFKRMRESIKERTLMMKIAPHLVHPLPVVMPTYGKKSKSRAALFLALLANDLIGYDRNTLNDPGKFLPRGRIISKNEVRKIVPGYDKQNMSGGAIWYDCQCFNTERMALSYVLTAVEHGADAANYVECTGFISDSGKVSGIRAKDSLTGRTFDIRSKVVINAGGPWVDTILGKARDTWPNKRFLLSSAMNVVVRRKILDGCSAGLPAPFEYRSKDGSVFSGSRMLFFVPWRGYTIIGTDHMPYDGKPDEFNIEELQIENFLDAVNQAYPAAKIKLDDVAFIHSGLLPMVGVHPETGEVELLKQYRIHDHLVEDKIEGLITVMGVKYTTHRDVIEKTTDLVFNKLGMSSPECVTGRTPLCGGDIERFDEYLSGALRNYADNKRTIGHLVRNYGTGFKDILGYGNEDRDLLQNVPDSDEVIKAEVVHAVRNEMAVKLADVVLRRTDIGSAEYPGDAALTEAARIMAGELGWSEDIIESEISETKNCYARAINTQSSALSGKTA
jgi:glycerol-3-phosphate dehydrogenase